MKFANLMYNGKQIKVIVDLDNYFIEDNDEQKNDNNDDTLDLSNITEDIEETEV